MFSVKKLMSQDVFEETIQQIIKVQLWIGQYNLKQRKFRNEISSFTPNSVYFQLRNYQEGLRINKLKLIKRKNNLQTTICQN